MPAPKWQYVHILIRDGTFRIPELPQFIQNHPGRVRGMKATKPEGVRTALSLSSCNSNADASLNGKESVPFPVTHKGEEGEFSTKSLYKGCFHVRTLMGIRSPPMHLWESQRSLVTHTVQQCMFLIVQKKKWYGNSIGLEKADLSPSSLAAFTSTILLGLCALANVWECKSKSLIPRKHH